MTDLIAVKIIEIIIAIAFLVWFFSFVWQKFAVDLTRQSLFEIRSKLFFMAADGNLDFKSKEYVLLEKWINSQIKYAHFLKVRYFIAVFLSGHETKKEPEISSIIEKIEDEELRTQLESIYFNVILTMVKLTILRSPALFLSLILTSPFIVLAKLFLTKKTEKIQENIVHSIDVEPNYMRNMEITA